MAAGHEAVHWRTLGASDAADEALLAWAQEHNFTVMTHDLDFGALLATRGLSGPSVVQIRAESHLPRAIGPQVLAALRQHERDLLTGAIVTIDGTRTRMRTLPIA
jgi:predicted nuclease of predicted toxin-antitoxin system